MADLVTRCPACRTAFRVVQDQLRLRDGRVRCGVCHHVFDARAEEVAFDPRELGAGVERQRVPAPPASLSGAASPTAGARTPQVPVTSRAPSSVPPARTPAAAPSGVTARREPASPWPYDAEPVRANTPPARAPGVVPPGAPTRREPAAPWPYDSEPTRSVTPPPRVASTPAPEGRRAPVAGSPSARPVTERAEPVFAATAGSRGAVRPAAPDRAEPVFASSSSQRPPLERAEPQLGTDVLSADARPTDVRSPDVRSHDARAHDVRPRTTTERAEPELNAPVPATQDLPPFIARRPEATRSSLEPRGTAPGRSTTPGFVARPARVEPVSPVRDEPVVSRTLASRDDAPAVSAERREPPLGTASREPEDRFSAREEDRADAAQAAREIPREPSVASPRFAASPDKDTDADDQDEGPHEPAFAAGPSDGWHTPLVAARRRREIGLGRRLLLGGCVLALIGLLFQAAWWWRTPLATYAPGTRPALETMCRWFGCSVDYVRAPRQLSIESSSVQPDTSQPGGDLVQRLTLSAVLRNRAAHDQPWPSLELSLTDFSDTVIMRRVIPPEGYLGPAGADGSFAAGSEQRIAVGVSARGAPITGYRLALFFP